ncbi:MAG: hypothetical protein C0508_23830, partial [Cyanobacteria bacterium PR.023]|nr:hypothetical protein [Cyanobacteria bacterium PR.023]
MNDFYRRFIAHGIELASLHGLQWDLPIDTVGKIPKAARWSLTALCGQVPPPELWHSTLSFDSNALESLNALREQQHLEAIPHQALPPHWRNFYQAVLLNELISKKNKPSHALLNIGRPLRIIATCAYSEAPWDLTAETIQRAYNVALGVGSSGKVAANLAMVVRMLIDG